MPFIISRVNIAVTDEQEEKIKAALGRAIELVPGKTENIYVMYEDIKTWGVRGFTFER